MSKVDQAKAIYAANLDKSRKEVIALIQEALQATPVSASSYYATAKAAARIAAEAANAPQTKSETIKEVAATLGLPVVDIKMSEFDPADIKGVPVAVEPAKQVKVRKPKVKEIPETEIPSRYRIADPNAPATDQLTLYYRSLSDEERATWTQDIAAFTEEYTKNPITFLER